jgi:hypothetical protein
VAGFDRSCHFVAHRLPIPVAVPKIVHKQFTFLGNAYWPSISPDGTLVAFVSANLAARRGAKADVAGA